MADNKDRPDDTAIIDELMKDEIVKEAIEEFVALGVAAALKNIEASKKKGNKVNLKNDKKKILEKPKCFGKYFEDDPKACRACRFAPDCKKKSKKK